MTSATPRAPRAKRTAQSAEFAVIGLGRMGGNLARHALELQCKVAGFARRGVPDDLASIGLVGLRDLAAIRRTVGKPRLVMLYLPAGPAIDAVLDELGRILAPGDVIADGGNSYWGDSIARAQRLERKQIDLIDVGTSGGVEGARRGACFMVGGKAQAVAIAEPLLRRLAVPGGFVHAGGPGAGHFTKLVHNGIEFGMLQAIGEGVALLERYREALPVADVLQCWRHGSVIRSWLIDLMHGAYRAGAGIDAVPPFVEDTGEVNWLIDDALKMEVAVPVIAQSVMQLLGSRDERGTVARAVAMMRHGFGGHPFGADERIARERREGRIGPKFQEGK